MSNAQDLLKSALLQSTVSEETNLVVKAEDLDFGSGIDYSKHFFEPKPGNTYLIKFLPNPGGKPIEHRSVYRNLPDPERKGKSFHYISSGQSATCKALELFFDLYAKKKEGDAIAEKKIDKYMSRTNQGCCKIQVLTSPIREEIGTIRLFVFSTFGPNATVANLLSQKVNPTAEQIKLSYEKEDVFNIFGSDVMSIVCEEADYDGVKGRDFTKSGWLPKKQRGAIGILPDGTTHEFVPSDLENGAVKADVVPFFDAFAEELTKPDYDMHNYFAYKVPGDPKNTKETDDYLKKVFAKVDEIIPIIKEKTLAEIAAYGKAEAAPSSANGEKKEKSSKNVLADSLPDELTGSIMGTETKNTQQSPQSDDEVDNVLNS